MDAPIAATAGVESSAPGADARAKLAYLLAPEKEVPELKPTHGEVVAELDENLADELREAEARLGVAEREAAEARRSVQELRARVTSSDQKHQQEPLRKRLSPTPCRSTSGVTTPHQESAHPPCVLGISQRTCRECRRNDAVTSRIFAESGQIFCNDCWARWDRSGWWKPSIRISTTVPPLLNPGASPGEADVLPRRYTAEDAFCLPGFLCAHDDFSLFERLRAELPEGRDFSDWHGSRHMGIQFEGQGARHNGADAPPALRATVAKMEAALGIRASASRLNLYRSNEDYKPFHYDRGSDSQGIPQVTVGASFGATRELTLVHVKSGVTCTLPQRNGDIFAFTPELNDVFMHGVPRIGFGSPSELEPVDAPRLSLILWGSKVQLTDGSAAVPSVAQASE